MNYLHYRHLLIALCVATLAACGFQLRGTSDLSFSTIFIQHHGASSIAKHLQRSFASSGVQVLSSAEGAEMQLELLSENTRRQILSLSGSGTVREYEVIYQVTLRIRPASEELWSAPQIIETRRDYSFDNSQLLAKEAEEARLFNDMRNDTAREIMRRLSAIKASKPSAAN
jgi:LPS-assembly lipoprotein